VGLDSRFASAPSSTCIISLSLATEANISCATKPENLKSAFDMINETAKHKCSRSGRQSITLLFLCLARNCEATLPKFFSYLDLLDNWGFHCTSIIGEDSSRDRTRALILDARGSRIELIDTSFMAEEPSRLKRMALGREALLDVYRARRGDENFVCVADLDNVMISPPTPAAVKNAIDRLRLDRSLFALGATSRPVYYDLLSFKANGQDYRSLNTEISKAKKNPLTYFQFHKRRIYKHQRLLTQPEPIPCCSSFNGFCIYNAEDYSLGSYRADDEADVCEHVSFNLSIIRQTGKGMLIAPELFIQTPRDHAPVGVFRFWCDRVGKL